MRSKAHFQGHPIHPALVHFPIAFLIGAFGFDLVGRLLEQPFLWLVGAYLNGVGVLAGVIAAVPGLIDYLFTVPPNSSGKRRATLHFVANASALGFFAAAWLTRGGVTVEPSVAVLVLEGIGALLLGYGGYSGGILVTRNQIGVDHRYAKAGKWREERVAPRADGSILAARTGELELDQLKLLKVGGQRIVLGRTEEGYLAFDDRCTHRGGSLADGVLIAGTVQCPWHGAQFDCRTGAVCNGPAREPIQTYRVEVKGDEVLVRIDLPSQGQPDRRGVLQSG